MELIIVTGLSGAGKSKTIEALEDMKFYCIDNIPPELIEPLVNICVKTKIDKIVLVVDIRGGIMFNSLIEQVNKIDKQEIKYKILFLDAEDDVIIARYKETRRKHPLVGVENKTILEAILAERNKMEILKDMADIVINTSSMTVYQLKEKIREIFLFELNEGMIINCVSFGFKKGVPHDADIVFDVRCLPNPFYIPELKHHTGLERKVQDYIMEDNDAKEYQAKIFGLLDFLIPLYKKEGKAQLVIAIGCTGGKHRSVTFVELLAKHISKKFKEGDYKVLISHREIKK